jgi:anti-anti-sigma factor
VEIRTRLDGDEMRIELEGRLDAAWSGTVGKALQETLHAGCHSIALDLSKVSYLSSAGIRVLAMLAKQLKAIGGRLRIPEASPPVREVLKLVGFQSLLEDGAASPPQPRSAGPRHRRFDIGEHGFEGYELNAGAIMDGTLIGDPKQAFDDTPRRPISLSASADTLVIGLGALGGRADCGSRTGELLAVDGLAIALPGDDPAHPDWLVREGDLVPEVSLLHGLRARGPFRHLLRFGLAPEAPALRLSELALAVLEAGECDQAAFVAVAETASLVGAALQAPPGQVAGDLFAFPEVRNRLLFTAEPAHADETCLIVGLVARRSAPPSAAFLRPMGSGSPLSAHLHAAAVPYHPVHKGLIGLRDTLDTLMESQRVRGVLHLLNDDREGVGAGESYLRRGAVWCAPVTFNDGGISA